MASSGNFCTLNPLDCDDAGDLTNGNLTLAHTDSAWRTAFGSMGVSSGKWYFESRQVNSASGNGYAIAVHRMSEGLNYKSWTNQGVGGSNSTYGYGYAFYTKGSGDASEKVHNNSFVTTSDITAGVAGDVYQIALDLDNNKVWFGKNNTWHNSGDPANNSNETYSSLPAGTYCSAVCVYTTSSDYFTHNYGQDSTFGGVATAGGNADGNGFGDFAYAPPTGFLAICTGNLPVSDDIDPAQTDDDFPQKNFNVVTFNGNGSTNAVTGLGFQPDLIWGFTRDGSQSKRVVDSTRGGSSRLHSDLTSVANTSGATINSFDADGFTANGGAFNNDSGKACGAWCWRANGGTTSSNSDGALTSTVQANQAAGFSISKYTSNGSGSSFGHGLGAAPDWFMLKKIDNQARNWYCWHKDLTTPTTAYIRLNLNNAQGNDTQWDSTVPDSTKIYVNNSTTEVNNPSGDSYICYAWRGIEGYSKFGKYEGNGNADGPFMYTGFRPRMLFLKRIDGSHNWVTFDTATVTFNPVDEYANWDTGGTSAQSASDKIDILSNGWKLRSTGSSFNNSGSTYIYGAWGDVPFKYNNTF